MKYAAYPSYKPSGINYLGDVPEHWEVKRGRFCLEVNPRVKRLNELEMEDEVSFIPMEALGEYGGLNLDLKRQVSDAGNGYTEFQDGDVVVAKITPCFENGKGALVKGLQNGVALGTTEITVLRVLPKLERRFLFYITISSVYRKTGEAEMYGAGGQKRVPPEFNKNFRTPIPPYPEQQIISDYLDRETTKLNILITKNRELIYRLKEMRSALISRTVTIGLPSEAARAAGLDPYPKLEPSGIKWLGDMPVHWGIKKIKHIGSIRYGLGEPPEYVDDGLPFIRATDIKQGRIDLELVRRVSRDDVPWSKKPELKLHEILVVRSGAYTGDSAIVTDEVAGCIAGYDMVLTVYAVHPQFLAWALLSKYILQGQIHIERLRAAQPHLNAEELGRVIVLVPPVPEQCVIADYLDRKTAEINQMIDKSEKIIECSEEYRAALVTAAVTGKIDVREVKT